MTNLHKKSTTKKAQKPSQLTEERVREIAKEEIKVFMGQRAATIMSLINK